jgi:hypothetical protein
MSCGSTISNSTNNLKAASHSFPDLKWLWNIPLLRGQRAAPVVVPEGPAAGGGVWSSVVDPGIPLGPGLLATRVVFHGPPVRIATARINATAITANVRKLIEPSRS